MDQHILLKDLEIYNLARELSKIGWEIYKEMDWQTKKIMGDQFIESTDSVGANITEGYGRFHYLEKIKFCYNSRASLNECNDYWLEILNERGRVGNDKYDKFKMLAKELSIKLNNFISAIYRAKEQQISKNIN